MYETLPAPLRWKGHARLILDDMFNCLFTKFDLDSMSFNMSHILSMYDKIDFLNVLSQVTLTTVVTLTFNLRS